MTDLDFDELDVPVLPHWRRCAAVRFIDDSPWTGAPGVLHEEE